MKLIINEHQERLLIKEALNMEFSLEDLKSIKSFRNRINYCTNLLGKYIGKGSSRIVFRLNDTQVIKLAMNKKGLAQNEQEYSSCLDSLCNISTIIDENNSDNENFTFIIVEYASRATTQDFQRIMGLSFKDFCKFLKLSYEGSFNCNVTLDKETNIMIGNLVDNNEDFKDYYDYVSNYSVSMAMLNDMLALRNYGVVQRNGYEYIVLADIGLNEDIYNNYYSR